MSGYTVGLEVRNPLKVYVVCEACQMTVLEADKMELQNQRADDNVRSETFSFSNPYFTGPHVGERMACPYCGISLWTSVRNLWKRLQDEKLPKQWDE